MKTDDDFKKGLLLPLSFSILVPSPLLGHLFIAILLFPSLFSPLNFGKNKYLLFLFFSIFGIV
jgi:hypothetical protein